MRGKIKLMSRGVSTLLVPAEDMVLFRKKLLRFGSVGRILKHVLGKKRKFLKRLHARSSRIRYQEKGDFVRVSFRPESADWETLRLYAFSSRVSMTLLFVLLLKAQEDDGVPTKTRKITLTTTLYPDKSGTYLLINRLNQ